MSAEKQSPLTPDTIVDFIVDIFDRRGADSYLGEAVTMSQHMLQSALQAEEAGAGDELIAAALLHDIGHYTNEFPEDALENGIDNRHDDAGAAILAPFFPDIVTDCVRHHVQAKRYLCATDPAYFATLTRASVHSMNLQGGPMHGQETEEFRKIRFLDAAIQVRRWDDGGKIAGRETPPITHYVPLLQRVVDAHTAKTRGIHNPADDSDPHDPGATSHQPGSRPA
jgi:phosphonate degradation associated HDIG domain protein